MTVALNTTEIHPNSKAESSAVEIVSFEPGGGSLAPSDPLGHPPLPQVAMRVFVLLFLTLNFFFLLLSSGRVRTRDELNADLQAESLATRGSTSVSQAPGFFFYGKFDRWGEPQPPYGPAHAAFLIPWYAAGRAFLAVLPRVPDGSRQVVIDNAVVASSGTFAALAVALAFLIFVRLGFSLGVSLAASSMLALSTPILAYSTQLYSEPLTAALLLGAVAVLFASGGEKVSVSWKEGLLAGILLGTAIWVRPTHAVAAPVFFAGLHVGDNEKRHRAAKILAIVVALFGMAYLARNLYLFGDPFEFGYPAVSDGGKNMNSFDTPMSTGLYGFLLSPGKSLFLFAPPILLAIAGIRKLVRLDKGLALVVAALPVVYLFFYAKFTQWEGGFCIGPRYLVPSIAVLCLGLGPALGGAGTWVKRAGIALALAGFAVQAVNIATSYFEDQANGNYYDAHYNYRMGYAPLVTMSRQLIHYLTSPVSAPLGRGFDRWFVFLSKAGVSKGTIAAVLALELIGFGFFSTWLVKTLRSKAASASA
jgi:hypothetical protein